MAVCRGGSTRDRDLPRIEAFADALMRDPQRAAHVRNIRFVHHVPNYFWVPPPSTFPIEPTEQVWASLEEALRLLIRVERVRLVIHEQFESSSPCRLVNILGNVFNQSCVTRLDARLSGRRLLSLCQAWPSLTTLSTGEMYGTPLAALSPGALPKLRHVRSNIASLLQVIPGRPIETVYNDEQYKDNRGDALGRFNAIIQHCKTLRKARLHCIAESDDVLNFLPGFTHDNLRDLYLFVEFEDHGHVTPLIPSSIMQALPPGVLGGFPKLEFLQVMLFDSLFLAHHIGSVDSKDLNAAAEALSTFLGSEGHSTLNRIDIGFWGWAGQYQGGIRFIATRRGNLWDVGVVDRDWSMMPRFDDML